MKRLDTFLLAIALTLPAASVTAQTATPPVASASRALDDAAAQAAREREQVEAVRGVFEKLASRDDLSAAGRGAIPALRRDVDAVSAAVVALVTEIEAARSRPGATDADAAPFAARLEAAEKQILKVNGAIRKVADEPRNFVPPEAVEAEKRKADEEAARRKELETKKAEAEARKTEAEARKAEEGAARRAAEEKKKAEAEARKEGAEARKAEESAARRAAEEKKKAEAEAKKEDAAARKSEADSARAEGAKKVDPAELAAANEKADVALAAETELVAGQLAALEAALARTDLAVKTRERAEKLKKKLEDAAATIGRAREAAESTRSAPTKDAPARLRKVGADSRQRAMLLAMAKTEVKKLAGDVVATVAETTAKPSRPALLATCDLAFSSAASGASAEIDGRTAVPLPVTVHVATGRHRALVKSGSASRTTDAVVVCGVTERVVLPSP